MLPCLPVRCMCWSSSEDSTDSASSGDDEDYEDEEGVVRVRMGGVKRERQAGSAKKAAHKGGGRSVVSSRQLKKEGSRGQSARRATVGPELRPVQIEVAWKEYRDK